MPKCPHLLVSVRNSAEAADALAGGTDILDMKEPARGPLGMCDPNVIREIVNLLNRGGRSVPASAALGEVADWESVETPALPCGLTYVKIGLAGLRGVSDWIERWRSVRQRFESRAGGPIGWIAVAYADREAAGSPSLEEIVQAAMAGDCAGVLIDTVGKTQGSLLDWLSVKTLTETARNVGRAGLTFAVAGRLQPELLQDLVEVGPDIVAIRSSACRGGRRGEQVDSEAVRSFREQLDVAFGSSRTFS